MISLGRSSGRATNQERRISGLLSAALPLARLFACALSARQAVGGKRGKAVVVMTGVSLIRTRQLLPTRVVLCFRTRV
jgi:hypothetical protein